MTIKELKELDSKDEKFVSIFNIIIEEAKEQNKLSSSYTVEKLYEESGKLGYSPIHFIVEVEKLFDYNDVARIWANHFHIIYSEDKNISSRHSWYIEYKDNQIGVTTPVDYISAEESFKDKSIVLVPYHLLQMQDIEEDGVKGFFYSLVQTCQEIGITDIHFEIREYGYEIKGRLLGDLIPLDRFAMEKAYILQQVIKNIAAQYSQLDTEQWNMKQDARIEIPERKLDLRLAFTPSLVDKFQNFVIRLLSKELTRVKGKEDIKKLGYLDKDADVILEYNNYKTGLNLMSGATGSGKSRSLNSFISLINTTRSIRTVEDPVEYVLENAVQHQTFKIIKDKEEDSVIMDYLAYTVAFMRQDPDVIFVGEWRKMKELTEALLYASETGHLVYSTLHSSRVTNIPNLLVHQYGLKQDDLANNINILINQKLVKKICPHCCSSRKFTEEDLSALKHIKMVDAEPKFEQIIGEEIKIPNEHGCKKCRVYHPQKEELLSAGYIGRTVLYEYMIFDIETRMLISDTVNALEIERRLVLQSRAKKAKTYVDIGIEKLLLGEIDLETLSTELSG